MKLTKTERHALLKCVVAACFRSGAPRATAELARQSYGFVRNSREVYAKLIERGLAEWPPGEMMRCTEAGLAALIVTPSSLTDDQIRELQKHIERNPSWGGGGGGRERMLKFCAKALESRIYRGAVAQIVYVLNDIPFVQDVANSN